MNRVPYADSGYVQECRVYVLQLVGSHCMKCGSTEALQFDHIDPTTKSFEITARIGSLNVLNDPIFMKELAKCQVLCAPCHRTKSAEEHSARQDVGHGKGLTGKKNCRCELCAPLKTAYHTEYERMHPRKR
jgi:5-methylcytosine-specific restriction endonuclease McrA